MLGKLCVIYILLLHYTTWQLWERVTQTLLYSKFTLHKRGWFLILRIAHLILCNNYLLASRLCMGKAHLKIRYHKRGLGLKKDYVMNMRDLRHEYGAPAS